MKNLFTALLLIFAIGFAGAQRHPPKPKHPFQSAKHKKPGKHKKFDKAKRGDRPYFVTPSGKRIGPPKHEARKRPTKKHPPRPHFIR